MNHNGTSMNTMLSRPSTSGNNLYSVTSLPKSKVIPKVVEIDDLLKPVNSHLTTNKIIESYIKVLASGLLKIYSEPINAYFKENRNVHQDYLKVTKELVAMLQELLKEAKALKPLDEHIGYASKFVEKIQELLVEVFGMRNFFIRSLTFLESLSAIKQLAKQGLVKGLPKLEYTIDHLCLACQIGKKAARTMLIFFKSLLFPWAEAAATACYTQNRSLIHTHYNKTLYELLRDCKLELKYPYVFGDVCYPTNNCEDLGKLQHKASIGIFINYLPPKKAYQMYNKKTRQIMETMNVQFDELTQMASEQHGSGPKLYGLTFGHISLEQVHNQAVVKSAKHPTKNDLDLLFQPMFDEYFKPPCDVFSPISAKILLPSNIVRASSSTFIDQEAPSPSTLPNIKATNSLINTINVKQNEEIAEFNSDTFTNPFAPPDTSSAE
nr:hypothetical protein [Tanacetum cinerariifolium]